jgi:hypothetical protein
MTAIRILSGAGCAAAGSAALAIPGIAASAAQITHLKTPLIAIVTLCGSA